MSTIVEVVVQIKDFISLHGQKGVLYSVALTRLKLKHSVGLAIAKKFLARQNYSFVSLDGSAVDLNSIVETDQKFQNLRCVAPICDSWDAFRIGNFAEIPSPDSALYQILELLGAARDKGCLQSDIAKTLNLGGSVYVSVDKLVGLGVLTKRSVISVLECDAQIPAAQRRLPVSSSKTTIVHLTRFAEDYDCAADGLQFNVNSSFLEDVHELLATVMEEQRVETVPANDLAKWLRIPLRTMQNLRQQTLESEKKNGPGKIRFVEAICNPQASRGGLLCSRLAWCITRETPEGRGGDGSSMGRGHRGHSSSRNLPLYEHVVASLRTHKDGLFSSDIGRLTGLTTKAAYKLVLLLSGQFGFPVEKRQDGKVAKYLLRGKETDSTSTAAVELGGGEGAATRDVASTGAGAATGRGDKARPAVRLSDNGGDLSNLQIRRAEIVLQFLAENDGVVTVYDAAQQVREVHQAEGYEYTADKRTIERLLERLVGEGRVRVVSVDVPTAESASLLRRLVGKFAPRPGTASDSYAFPVLLLADHPSACSASAEDLQALFVRRHRQEEAEREEERKAQVARLRKRARLSARDNEMSASSGESSSGESSEWSGGDDDEEEAAGRRLGAKRRKTGLTRPSPEKTFVAQENVASSRRRSKTHRYGRNNCFRVDEGEEGDSGGGGGDLSLDGDAKSIVFRKRRSLSAKQLAVTEFPRRIRTVETLVGNYAAGGFAVSCLNAHIALLAALGRLDSPQKVGLFERVPFVPAEVLFSSLSAQFLLRNYPQFLPASVLEAAQSSPEFSALLLRTMDEPSVTVAELLHLEAEMGLSQMQYFVDALRTSFAQHLMFLVSVGIVQLEGLPAVLAGSEVASGGMRVGTHAADVPQMRAYAELLRRTVFEQPVRGAEDTDQLGRDILSRHCLLQLLPAGSLKAVNSVETVMRHWRDIVAESIAFQSCEGSRADSSRLLFGEIGSKRRFLSEHGLSATGTIRSERRDLGCVDIEQAWAGALLPLDFFTCPAICGVLPRAPRSVPTGRVAGATAHGAGVGSDDDSSDSDASAGAPAAPERKPTDRAGFAHKEKGAAWQRRAEYDSSSEADLVGAGTTDDVWTPQQDMLLLRNFFVRFLLRTRRDNFPVELQSFCLHSAADHRPRAVYDVEREPLAVQLRVAFCTNLGDSCFECDYAMKDLAAEPLTALSKVSLRAGHTLSAAKSRIEFLHKDIGTMRRLGALVLCGQDLIGPLERPTVDTLNRVFARAPQQEQSELKLIASAAVRLMRSAADPSCRESDLIALVDVLRGFPEPRVALVYREFYAAGLIRKRPALKPAEIAGQLLSGAVCGHLECAVPEVPASAARASAAPVCVRLKFAHQSVLAFELTEQHENSFSVLSTPYIEAAHSAVLQSQAPSQALRVVDPSSRDVSPLESLALAHSLALHSAALRTRLTVGPPQYLDLQPGGALQHTEAEEDRGSTGGWAAVKRVTAPTIGHAHRSLNRVTVAVAAAEDAPETRPPCDLSGRDDVAGSDSPWTGPDGASTDSALVEQHASKLLAVLAERPGFSQAGIRAAFPMLDAASVQSLLDMLHRQGAVWTKQSTVKVRRDGPFSASKSNFDSGSDTLYFVRHTV